MNPARSILLSAASLACCAFADDAESSIRFSNDDRLAGALESLTPDTLVWRSPVLEHPAPFFLRNVTEINIPAAPPANAGGHEATINLTNGDVVRGQLVSVTDTTVSLDTWFAGTIHFNRLMVSSVTVGEKPVFLYQGPNGLDGWRQFGESDEPAWTYSRGAFRSQAAGSIARPDLLPDECSIQFETAWRADSIALKVVLFSDNPASDGENSGYELSFQRGSVYLRNSKKQSFLGSTHSRALLEADKVRVEIRASRKSGKVCLYINGNILEVWTDPDVAEGQFGSCLHFVSQNTLPLKISSIAIAPWNGVVEQMPEPRLGMMRRQFGLPGNPDDEPKPAPAAKPADGAMELANGDSLEGEILSIQAGVITMKTPLGEVKLPVNRLRTVALKKVDLERAIRKQGDLRAWFPDGSVITFRLDGMADGKLTGYSQNFGTAAFQLAAFQRIEFNIYEPALEDKRGDDNW
jgi:hypothetical protein